MILGYQAVYDSSFFEAIDYASANHFDYVSFDLNVPRFYIDKLKEEEIKTIRDYSKQKGVKLAFHAPGDNISLFSDYPAIREGILNHFTKIIKVAEKLNARHVTIHPGSYPALKKVKTKEDEFSKEYAKYFSQVLYENLYELAKVSTNVLICVENFNLTEITMEAISRLLQNKDIPIFLTWDIAKTYDGQLNCNYSVQDFMYKYKDKIREIHAHDMIKGFKSHETIGTGDLDFTQYREIFMQHDIAITIEVRPREEALISRDNLIKIL